MQVLLVCTGNTCRSPLAAVILQRLLREGGPEGVEVESAGTGAQDGAPASEGAYLVALEEGLDLSTHRARLLTPELVRRADLILAMSRSQLWRIRELGGAGKALLLGEYATGGTGEEEVHDPFGGEVSAYRETCRQLSRLMEGTRRRLLTEFTDDHG
jgi:protein-tyrosine-phosphatase